VGQQAACLCQAALQLVILLAQRSGVPTQQRLHMRQLAA
jgi:hypothetical protein